LLEQDESQSEGEGEDFGEDFGDGEVDLDLRIPDKPGGFRIPETYDNNPDHYIHEHNGFYFDSGDEYNFFAQNQTFNFSP
jgi:hypothetical protein